MAGFEDVMNMAVESAVKPPPLPAGTFRAVITKFEPGASREKKTPLVKISARLLAALADVDTSKLDPSFNQREVSVDYYLTKDAAYRLRELIEAVGISTAGRTFSQTLPEVVGKMCTVLVVQQPRKNKAGQIIPGEVSSYADSFGPDQEIRAA